jgi:ankyrin repeat protein
MVRFFLEKKHCTGLVLSEAVSYGHFEIVRLRVDSGFRPQIYNLIEACREGNIDIVEYLLNWNIDISRNRNSLLQEAIQNKHWPVVQLLWDRICPKEDTVEVLMKSVRNQPEMSKLLQDLS